MFATAPRVPRLSPRRVAGALALASALGAGLALGPVAQDAQAAKARNTPLTRTVNLNRAETKDVADGGDVAGAALCGVVAAFTGPGGAICGAAAGPFVVQAIRADNRGMCLRVRQSKPFPGVVWPDIYRGPDCR